MKYKVNAVRNTNLKEYTQQPPLRVPTLKQGSTGMPHTTPFKQLQRNVANIGSRYRVQAQTSSQLTTKVIPSVGTTVNRTITRINTFTQRFERK